MKQAKTILAGASLALAMSLPVGAANTLKMAYDADPVSLDPHEQLSGGTLQLGFVS